LLPYRVFFQTEALYIVRAALLSNPHSARNRRRLGAVDARISGRVLHRVSENLDDLGHVLREFADGGVELIGINGGDGTVHRVLTELAQAHLLGDCPKIAMLPGGSTNMTARDLNGGSLSLEQSLDAFLLAVERDTAPVTLRSTVRVISEERPPQVGFCFGMGAVVRGIEYCHERIFSLGIRKEWASGAALLRAAWGIARRERIFADGVTLEARYDGDPSSGRASIFLVSALERLFLGIKPFWGVGPEPLATTWVSEDATRFMRTLPALLRGDASRLHVANGYSSRRARDVEVRGGEQFTIDGEIYRNSADVLYIDSAAVIPVVPLHPAS
jgi:diacylglycerol kinase family enzyme